MMTDPITRFVMDYALDALAGIVLPIMLLTFMAGTLARFVIFYIAKTENRFSLEFEKRVRYYFATPDVPRVPSFYRITRILLEKTYNDCFEKREKYKRRSLDHIWSATDRLFLTQDGVKRLIEDSLRQIRYFRKNSQHEPDMLDTSKQVFENNPYFNRVFGIIPLNLLHEVLNMLPGLFLIGGIFGTFLGIAKGLPELGSMDLGNLSETKRVMDLFLAKIAMAMVKSILGIGLSAVMSVINTLLSVDGIYFNVINRYSGALDHLWKETTTNEIDRVESQPNSQDAA